MTMPIVLTIAGTDPTAGAGLQADCKTITVLGGYAVSAITAVVAQNTQGVITFTQLQPDLIQAQLKAVSQDTHIDAIKIGMLGNSQAIMAVSQWLKALPSPKPPVVIDPVMVATSGDLLFDSQALADLKSLIAQCDVVTPNISELAALTSSAEALTFEDALAQGQQLACDVGVHVVVKGGHLPGKIVHDALIELQTSSRKPIVTAHLTNPRINTHRTHGTGCAYSSAIATKLAHQPANLVAAVTEARSWLQHAISHADALAFGKGNGPIHHTAQIFDEAVTAPAHHLLPAGQESSALSGWWQSCERIRNATDRLQFVSELGTGRLPPARFAYYLQQDALYLREYSKALAVAADLAPTLIEQRFWMQGAHNCLIEERRLHDSWLAQAGADLEEPEPSSVTRAYTGHFLDLARQGNYEELIAALLPCYWMYQDIGTRLEAEYQRPDHPYRNWLTAYADPGFALSTLSARAIVAHHVADAIARGDEGTVARMHQAFLESCQFEHDFFEAPYGTEFVDVLTDESLLRA